MQRRCDNSLAVTGSRWPARAKAGICMVFTPDGQEYQCYERAAVSGGDTGGWMESHLLKAPFNFLSVH